MLDPGEKVTEKVDPHDLANSRVMLGYALSVMLLRGSESAAAMRLNQGGCPEHRAA